MALSHKLTTSDLCLLIQTSFPKRLIVMTSKVLVSKSP